MGREHKKGDIPSLYGHHFSISPLMQCIYQTGISESSGHNSQVNAVVLVFGAGGSSPVAYSGGNDRAIRVHDISVG